MYRNYEFPKVSTSRLFQSFMQQGTQGGVWELRPPKPPSTPGKRTYLCSLLDLRRATSFPVTDVAGQKLYPIITVISPSCIHAIPRVWHTWDRNLHFVLVNIILTDIIS